MTKFVSNQIGRSVSPKALADCIDIDAPLDSIPDEKESPTPRDVRSSSATKMTPKISNIIEM